MTTFAATAIWSDAQLAEAVRSSSNWRGVMRELGLNATSAGAIRIVRRHAVRLGLDTSHFRGKRRWSDAQLKRAVSEAQSWDEVLDALGLADEQRKRQRTHMKSHAIRLGLDFGHLDADAAVVRCPLSGKPDLKHLREAGASIAAAWFTLCGFACCFPSSPPSTTWLCRSRTDCAGSKSRRRRIRQQERLDDNCRTPSVLLPQAMRPASRTILISSTTSSSSTAISICT